MQKQRQGDHRHTLAGDNVHKHSRDAKTQMAMNKHKVYFMLRMIKGQSTV